MAAAEALAKIRADFGANAKFAGHLGHLGHLGQLEQRGKLAKLGELEEHAIVQTLSVDWPKLAAILPDGALPPGVTELSSQGLVASSIAAQAVKAAQARQSDAWCGWIDPEGTLYAPGLASAGVDLARLLVAQPERRDLGRIAVKMALSGAFDLLVVDMDAAAGAAQSIKWPTEQKDKSSNNNRQTQQRRARKQAWPSDVLVRKLALAVEDGKTHVLLLTDAAEAKNRVTSWPVALRLDITRGGDEWSVTVGKERRGRIGRTGSIPLLDHHVSLTPSAPLARTNPERQEEPTNVIVPLTGAWERKNTG